MRKIQWMATFEGSSIRKNFEGEVPSKSEFMELHRLWGYAYFVHHGWTEEGEKKERKAILEFEKELKKMEKKIGFKFDYKADSNWFIIEESKTNMGE